MSLKKIFAPHLNREVKFGRTRPTGKLTQLKFGDYVQPSLPPPPASVDYSSKAAQALSLVYLNNQLGDCVIAGGYHVTGVETGNAGDLFVATDAQILGDYSKIGGYVPGDESTDNGCDEQTALDYWENNGFANGTKPVGHLALDATNQNEIMQAAFLFENLYFGLELPDSWINPFPSADGFVWDVGTPDSSNGHCIIGVGYNAEGVQVDSWGLLGTVTWAAIQSVCSGAEGGQIYAILTPDQIDKGQIKAPNGLDWPTLLSDFKSVNLANRGGLTAKPA